MLSDQEFRRLVSGLRAGDEEAVRECIRHFEPEIRRAARVRLTDPNLRRFVDSLDITQSVFRRFLTRCQEDPYALERPEELLALLVTMTRNRVTDWARKRRLEQRLQDEVRRLHTTALQGSGSEIARGPENDELLQEVRSRMTPEEFEILRRRCDGEKWDDIGAAMDAAPDALRKRLERALVRVRKELAYELADGY